MNALIQDLRAAFEYAGDWIAWTLHGWPEGVRKGVYDGWDLGEYLASGHRVCRLLMYARMNLRGENN